MEKPVSFEEIQKEFSETFGYFKSNINVILEKNPALSYTIAWLVCCACEMLAYHKERDSDEVFSSLLPEDERFTVIGEVLWKSLSQGLSHHFRPETIRIDNKDWRFTIFSGWGGPILIVKSSLAADQPNWIHLNIRTLSTRIIAQIDAFEQELRMNEASRCSFDQKAKVYTEVLPSESASIADALRSIVGSARD